MICIMLSCSFNELIGFKENVGVGLGVSFSDMIYNLVVGEEGENYLPF